MSCPCKLGSLASKATWLLCIFSLCFVGCVADTTTPTGPSGDPGKADGNAPVWNATMAVMVEDFAAQEDLQLGTFPGENCVALPNPDGSCPSAFQWMNPATGEVDPTLVPDYLGTPEQLELCFQRYGMPLYYSNTPSLWGHTKYDSRAYECNRPEVSSPNDFFRYFEYEPYDSYTPNIDRRGCGWTDNSCMDGCALQGREALRHGYVYRTELCHPVYLQFQPWWRPDYVCGGAVL